MVSVPYKIPLPASPPPTPPRDDLATVTASENGRTEEATPSAASKTMSSSTSSLSQPAAHSGKASKHLSMVRSAGIPSPDVSRDSHDESYRSDHIRKLPKLNDFELIRVLGKGCAGRVGTRVCPGHKCNAADGS